MQNTVKKSLFKLTNQLLKILKKMKSLKKSTSLIYFTFLLITGVNFGQNLPNFVDVQGGTFIMGDKEGLGNKDQRPTHQVTLKSFKISQTEVTVAQYRYYCNETGVGMPKEPSWGWQDNHPMVNVSWRDAMDYADWLSGKLKQKVRLPYGGGMGICRSWW